MYVPNPIAVEVLKVTTYTLFGWLVRSRSVSRRNPIVFGVLRVIFGWGVGILSYWLTMSILESDWGLLAMMAVPRFLLWAVLLRVYFQPIGGTRALLLWSLGGLTFSTATDLIIMYAFPYVDWLRVGWC